MSSQTPRNSPSASDPTSDRPHRTIGKRRAPNLADRTRAGHGPTPEEIEWISSMSQYRTRVPKGVFRYHSHLEANADWERWHADLVAEMARRRAEANEG
jgi:hypothetical protein